MKGELDLIVNVDDNEEKSNGSLYVEQRRNENSIRRILCELRYRRKTFGKRKEVVLFDYVFVKRLDNIMPLKLWM